jgi:pilus assembly protein CpaC
LLAGCFFVEKAGAEVVEPDLREVRRLHLIVGKTTVLKIPKPVRKVRAYIPDTNIAEARNVSPSSHEILITAKAPGTTNLTIWRDNRFSAIYDLEVSCDISRLKRRLHEILPDESDIRVIPTHDAITLAGRVSNAVNLSQAMALAEAFASRGKVKNLLEVGGVHQVMLEVRVAEISKSIGKRLGINFGYANSKGDFGISTLAGLHQVVDDGVIGTHGMEFSVSSAVNALFRFNHGSASWTGLIDALREDRLIKILAEPTLVALSGQTADFLVGGEFPIPIPQGLGTVAIEYKSFGVCLSFTPVVLSNNRISLKVAPEVSEIDFSTAIRSEGVNVPGLSIRKASTTIELADGQSFAIAGLLRDTARDSLSKFPGLGDIPVLGTLFRSREFQKAKTELIIVATPRLVKPLDLKKQTLPTDFYVEPDDADIYLWGNMEGSQWDSAQFSTNRGLLDGDFGHAAPNVD